MHNKLSQLFLLVILIFSGCQKEQTTISSLVMLEGGKPIAVPSGTVADQFVLDRFPDAQLLYYNSVLDCALAVKEGKAEAAFYDKPILKNIASKQSGLTVLDELLIDDEYGFAVKPNDIELKTAIDRTLAEIKANGTYDDMLNRWFPEGEPPKPMPAIEFTGENGILLFGTAAVTEPMSFYNGNRKIVGFDIEFASYIAQHMGKTLEIVDMEFGGLLPALLSGKVDMIGAGMSITKERAKSVLFSDCYYPSGIAAIVRTSNFNNTAPKQPEGLTIGNIDNKKMGVLMGSIHDKYATENYPNASIFQFQTVPDMLLSLTANRIDVAFFEDASLKEIMGAHSKIGVLQKNLFSAPIGAGFNKRNNELRDSYNNFLEEIKQNGVYDDIYSRWIDQGLRDQPEIPTNAINGELVVGISSDIGFPYMGIKDGNFIGFDVELARHFAAYLNKELVVSDMPFGSLIAALSSGKIDLIHSSLMITEERKEQIDFSNIYFESGATLIALQENIYVEEHAMFNTIDDIADKRIGIYIGTVHDAFLEQNYPLAQRFLYDSSSDLILSLKTDKVDAIMLDYISAKVMIKHNPELVIFNNDIYSTPLGVGFHKKNQALRNEFNQFLSEIKENGIYDEMSERWFVNDAELAVIPEFDYSENEKRLRVGVAVDDLPYVAYMNGDYVGFDIEMIKHFAQRNNYKPEIITIEFASLVAALLSGKVDLIADGISISEERAELIDFSDPYADFRTAVVVAKENIAGYSGNESIYVKTSFFQTLASGFHNNIVREKRYMLILNGLKVTLIISIFAALLGTLVGALLCFLRMSKNKITASTTALFIDLIRGTPVLVFLMITYYIIFASANINPVIVAVIAFGINFGAYVSEMFRTSILSIDKGQNEAGIASGFTRTQAFVHIIMPQALQRVLPVYKGEFISLVKMTSIVGYIAVQDLTKASDIIRSRTFDAFFPLIMAALLYIIIAALFTWALSYIEISVDPKRRKIKKEVEDKL